ncbi:MAG: hypothetical protein II644_01465 [Paludibacteraceae bacterium]|nr:hypothetical protein [Paludibacteraceae bacterium]
MKKCYYLALMALVIVAFSSCSLFGEKSNTPEFKQSELQGLWQENNTEHFVRFTEERSEEYPYFLGREWDDAEWDDPDMTYEEFLIWNREQLGHPGNGWFKYKLETSGTLTEIHLMDNEGAEIPKVYVVSKLTDTDLVYYEKEHQSIKFYFTKVVETK